MFALGLASGAAQEVSAGQERIRQRIERQLNEARQYADVARKREQEAQSVRTQIANAHKSYGVSEKTLFSAYRNGHFDDYLKLIEKARAVGGQDIDPTVLESYYEIPLSVKEADVNIDEEIQNAFGVVSRNLDNARGPEDVGFANLFFDALGVDTEGAARRGLRGQTVGGYNVESLLNMPSLSPIQGDGGKINPQLYAEASPPREGSDKGMFTPQQIVDLSSSAFTARVAAMFGGRMSGPAQREALERDVKYSVAMYLDQTGVKTIPTPDQIDQIASNVYREVGGKVFVNTMVENPNAPGTTMWSEINENGFREGQFSEEEIMGRAAAPTTQPTAPQTSAPAAQPRGGNFPQTVNHPQFGELPFSHVGADGKPRYKLPDGRVVPYNGTSGPNFATTPQVAP